MKVVYYIPDLMFRSRVEEILKHSPDIQFERLSEAVPSSDFDYLILNLEDEGALEAIEKYSNKVICYCAHVKIDLMKKAKESGCKHVYPRSAFFGQLIKILSRT